MMTRKWHHNKGKKVTRRWYFTVIDPPNSPDPPGLKSFELIMDHGLLRTTNIENAKKLLAKKYGTDKKFELHRFNALKRGDIVELP